MRTPSPLPVRDSAVDQSPDEVTGGSLSQPLDRWIKGRLGSDRRQDVWAKHAELVSGRLAQYLLSQSTAILAMERTSLIPETESVAGWLSARPETLTDRVYGVGTETGALTDLPSYGSPTVELAFLPPESWHGATETKALSELPAKGALYLARAKYLRSQEELLETFSELADQWERETLVISSPTDAIAHPAYHRVIGLGLQAVPLVLERLQQTRRYWFPALAAITGENPAEGVDTVPAAIEAWVEWGSRNGYLPIE